MQPVNDSELRSHIMALANRLRMIQADLADKDTQTQREVLCEEIERALKTLRGDQYAIFHEGLKNQFPVMADLGIGPCPVESEGSGKTELHGGRAVPERVLESLMQLTPEQRDGVISRAQGGEKKPTGDGCQWHEVTHSLRQILGMRDDQQVQADGLPNLLILLVDFVIRLEPVVWNTWSKLAPRTEVRGMGGVKPLLGGIVAGQQGSEVCEMERRLKLLQQLVIAMVTAVGPIGSQFAQKYLSTFSPKEIRAMVNMEGKQFLVSEDVQCWRKYEKLASSLNGETIEGQIQKILVEYVQALMKVGR